VSTTESSHRDGGFRLHGSAAAECVNETDATVAEKGAHFIAPIPEEFTRIRTKHSCLEATILPAGSYPGGDPFDRLLEFHARPGGFIG